MNDLVKALRDLAQIPLAPARIIGSMALESFRRGGKKTKMVTNGGLVTIIGLGMYACSRGCSPTRVEYPSEYPVRKLEVRGHGMNLIYTDKENALANQDESFFMGVHGNNITNKFQIVVRDSNGNPRLSDSELTTEEKRNLASKYAYFIAPRIEERKLIVLKAKQPSHGVIDSNVPIPVFIDEIW